LDNLLDAKLERSISTSEYLSKKDTLVNEKVRIEDKFAQLRGEGLVWLEPMREFILLSKQAKKVAISRDLLEIKNSMKNICSNFLLKDRTLLFKRAYPYDLVAKISPVDAWLPCSLGQRTIDIIIPNSIHGCKKKDL